MKRKNYASRKNKETRCNKRVTTYSQKNEKSVGYLSTNDPIQTVLINKLIMSKRRTFVTVTFRSEYCIYIYFTDSWNPINPETAQDTIMVLYDVKYI